MCPLSELEAGLNARPHQLEQWSAAMLQRCPCAHVQPTAELLPSSRAHVSRSTAHVGGRGDGRASASAVAARATNVGVGESKLQEFLAPVAAYRRSANAQASLSSADNAAHESSLLRTPEALSLSLDHLLECVLARLDPGLSFDTKYAFLSDRMRQIKKELTMQSLTQSDGAPLVAARILERMVRFYIVSLFVNFGSTPDQQRSFDPVMAEDRLNDCMHSLLQCCQFGGCAQKQKAASTNERVDGIEMEMGISDLTLPRRSCCAHVACAQIRTRVVQRPHVRTRPPFPLRPPQLSLSLLQARPQATIPCPRCWIAPIDSVATRSCCDCDRRGWNCSSRLRTILQRNALHPRRARVSLPVHLPLPSPQWHLHCRGIYPSHCASAPPTTRATTPLSSRSTSASATRSTPSCTTPSPWPSCTSQQLNKHGTWWTSSLGQWHQ